MPLIFIAPIAALALFILLLSLRMRHWWSLQHTRELEAQNLKASDLISLTSLALTVVSLFIGWYSIKHQIQKNALDIQIKNLADDNASLDRQVFDDRAKFQQAAINDTDIHLETPISNTRVLGKHLPELRWKYAKHGSSTDYLVEITRVDPLEPGEEATFKLIADPDCETGATSCRLRATSPSGESTRIPVPSDATVHQGRYLWRVSPISAGIVGKDYPDPHWSEYGAFCFYKRQPVPATCVGIPAETEADTLQKIILVGTNDSGNVGFSAITDGHRHGYDIDLIKFIIEGCVMAAGDGFLFDQNACAEYRSGHRRPDGLRVVFKTFDSIDEGLEALSRKQVDVFIGALTKADKRDTYTVRLTHGYYQFVSRLLARSGDGLPHDLASWNDVVASIGVIDNSTNQWLAEEILHAAPKNNHLTLQSFRSFPGLKEAFDEGKINAAVVDGTLRGQFQDAMEVELPKAARKRYLGRLGEEQEAFTVAVAVDGPDPSGAAKEDSHSLFVAIETALRSEAVQPLLKRINVNNGGS